MTIKIDIDDAIKLVNDAIAERGEDYVYPREEGRDCLYVHDEIAWDPNEERYVPTDGPAVPGCLVGLVLNKAGVSLERLQRHEGSDAEAVIEWLEADKVLEAAPKVNQFLYQAQFQQDIGKTWAEARSIAMRDALGLNPDGTEWAGTDVM